MPEAWEPLPGAPNAPTLERLWQLANYDPRFYVGLVAKYGYIQPAWKALDEPAPIRPFIPPRPVPPYIGAQASVGLFVTQLAPQF